MPFRHVPNLLSTLRILLVFPIIWALLQGHPTWALGLFIFAGLTDLLDGWLARRQHWSTRTGGVLDAIADKLLMLAVYGGLWWLDVFPAWLLGVVVGRDMLIILGCLGYWLQLGKFNPEPSTISKANTFMQIVLAILGIGYLSPILPISESILHSLIGIAVVTAVLSLFGYAKTWYQDVQAAK